ncbi:MAG TPA: pyridoxamine 5'-phosphate oxidase family protein [Verrucomicrobiae bacterium]|nr:pyridoxamine 5'-phosphate oxidase family protein [Verrucomicrobiae bacterium]
MRERLLRFLREHQVLTLAVTEADGSAYAAALFYAVDDELHLYVVTDPATRHGQAMAANPSVAGTIQRDRQQWHEIQGIQFRGLCRQLDGADRARGWEIYSARFPFLQQPNAMLTREMAKTALWRIEPAWMRLIDNRAGFGRKDEWTPRDRQ